MHILFFTKMLFVNIYTYLDMFSLFETSLNRALFSRQFPIENGIIYHSIFTQFFFMQFGLFYARGQVF